MHMQVHTADHRLSVRQADLPMLQSAKDDRMQEPRLRVRRTMVIGHSPFRSQGPTGSCRTVDMTQPGPDPDNYPPIDPTEPVPDDPGPLSPDTPETLPPAPVEPMPGPDDPDSVPVGQSV